MPDNGQKQPNPNAIWKAAKPIQQGDAVELYLRKAHGIELNEWPASLRCGQAEAEGHTYPVMVAMVSGADGKPAALQVTYLRPGGQGMANVAFPRKLLGSKPPDGAAIRLGEIEPTLGIATSIEDALALSLNHKIPVWAACNVSMLANWWPPDGVEDVAVFGAAAPDFSEQAAAYGLGFRLVRGGKMATVSLTSVIGHTWAEIMCGDRAA